MVLCVLCVVSVCIFHEIRAHERVTFVCAFFILSVWCIIFESGVRQRELEFCGLFCTHQVSSMPPRLSIKMCGGDCGGAESTRRTLMGADLCVSLCVVCCARPLFTNMGFLEACVIHEA